MKESYERPEPPKLLAETKCAVAPGIVSLDVEQLAAILFRHAMFGSADGHSLTDLVRHFHTLGLETQAKWRAVARVYLREAGAR